jgi:uncharacterized membrane protein
MRITSTAIVQWLTASIGAWAFLVPLVTQSATAQVPCSYTISHTIRAPLCQGIGYPVIGATGISPNGRYVCGYYFPCNVGNNRGFVFDTQSEQFVTLPHPAGVSSTLVEDVNDAGIAVGQAGVPGGYRGFVFDVQTGEYTFLEPLPGGAWAGALAMNNAQVVCGFRSIGSPSSPTFPQTAFLWSSTSGFQDLGILVEPGSAVWDINQCGAAVGRAGVFAGLSERGFVHANGRTTMLPPIPGGVSSRVTAINDSGLMILGGQLQTKAGIIWKAFIRDDDQLTELLPLPGDSLKFAYDLSNDATVVGGSKQSSQAIVARACIWRDATPIDLTTLLPPLQGLYMELCKDIAENGSIIVEGTIFPDHVVLVLEPEFSDLGDTDCNGTVDMDDLLGVITHWGPCYGCNADLTHDGTIDTSDLIVVIEHWDRPE